MNIGPSNSYEDQRKFASRKFQVMSLVLAFFVGGLGIILGVFAPQHPSPLFWLCLAFVYPFAYGMNELLKIQKLERHGWFRCDDCRREKSRRMECRRMKDGVMVSVCKTCSPHLDEVPLRLKDRRRPELGPGTHSLESPRVARAVS